MRIWGQDVIVTERTVDVNITRLRTKLGQFGSSLRNKTVMVIFLNSNELII